MLRPIRTWVNDALARMDAKFSAMYEADVKDGRPNIVQEKLMRAMLLWVLHSVRSKRQLVEQIPCNLLLRWFVGLDIEVAPSLVWINCWGKGEDVSADPRARQLGAGHNGLMI